MSPAKPKRSRLPSTWKPGEPTSGDTPAIAIERGRSSRAMSISRLAIAPHRCQAGAEGFVVEELLQALGTALLGVLEARLHALRHEIFVRLLPRHADDVAHRMLGRAQHGRVLVEQRPGERAGAFPQLVARHG